MRYINRSKAGDKGVRSFVLYSFTYTPSLVYLSHTHSEWPATGWCARTLILFSGGGHCHKRYCSLISFPDVHSGEACMKLYTVV